jgi:hypothetical protein
MWYLTIINRQIKHSHLGLSLLRLLGPKLHHRIHKPVNANNEDNDEPCIPPTIGLFRKVQRAQVIRTSHVLTDLTSRAIIRVEQVCRSSHSALIGLQILCTILTRWWIEEGNLVGSAVDWLVPRGEDH